MEELQIEVELLRKHCLKIYDNPCLSQYNDSSENMQIAEVAKHMKKVFRCVIFVCL